MPQPTLCMIFEAIGEQSAIAKIAMTNVRIALEAGYEVSVVAKYLDPSLRGQLKWLKLRVPPRVFLLKWLTARGLISRAIGGRRFDVVHAHQPQVASLADVFQCHFLTRVAYERDCLESRPGLRPAAIRVQEHGVLKAEDYYFNRWNPNTRMIFVSDMLRQEFGRLYGLPPREEVLINPMPAVEIFSDEERRAARQKLVGDFAGPVVGFLGGLQRRKGYMPLIDALNRESGLFLLMAGSYSEGYVAPGLNGRFKSLGLVKDAREFYAACDVLAVPSYFDPCPMVVFEAISHGVPVVATRGVGNLDPLLQFGTGAQWEPGAPLGPIVRDLAARRATMAGKIDAMSVALSEIAYKHRLLATYDQVMREKRPASTIASIAPTSSPVPRRANRPTLCMVFEAIGNSSAIAKVAMADVQIALDAGFDVSVVAKILDESLHDRVQWLKLTVPPRLLLLKWLTARSFIRRALGSRTFDVVHAHQPQAASLADVFQCHFLTRVAQERNCLEERPGLRPALIRGQQRGVLIAEDRFYRNWNPSTRMLFCSELLRREFGRLYGLPPIQDVLVYGFPKTQFATDEERKQVRRRFLGRDYDGLVLGYLGGIQERKGYRLLIDGLKGQKDVLLLMGGQYTKEFAVPELDGHYHGIGLTSDTNDFYAACDVVAVPSLFDPCPMVVFEAAARGVPVIATDGVGNLPNLVQHGAGARWHPDEPLAPLVRSMAAQREQYRQGILRMAADLSMDRYGHRMLQIYDDVMRAKKDRPGSRELPITASMARGA